MATLAFAALSKGDKGAHKAGYPGGKSAKASIGGFQAIFGQLTCDASYPDGGYTAATLEGLAGLSPYLSKIFVILPFGGAVTTDKFVPMGWDGTNRKLMAGTNAGAEFATNGAALDGAILTCLVLGRY